MKQILTAFLFAFCASLGSAQTLKVGSLHPLIGDLARQVGGDRVVIVDVLKPGSDMHHFEPTAKDVASLKGVLLVLASGKHLENYLDNLRDSLGGVPVIEVGRTIPSIKIDANSELFMCCPAHSTGGIDPHWWHSAENMQRAARVIAEEFTKLDPAGKDVFKANADAARQRLAAAKAWAQQQIALIPRSDRKLVTAHAAYGYFCKEFGFKSLPILGLGREDEASAQHIAAAVTAIRENKIRAAFPEDQANPKILKEIVRETGLKLGEPLVADGTSPEAHTFETMLRHNVGVIVKALKP
jgi:zinc/manganese transport system substrate-binding protein